VAGVPLQLPVFLDSLNCSTLGLLVEESGKQKMVESPIKIFLMAILAEVLVPSPLQKVIQMSSM